MARYHKAEVDLWIMTLLASHPAYDVAQIRTEVKRGILSDQFTLILVAPSSRNWEQVSALGDRLQQKLPAARLRFDDHANQAEQRRRLGDAD